MTTLDKTLLRTSFDVWMRLRSDRPEFPDEQRESVLACRFDVFDELPSTNRHLMDICRNQPDEAIDQTRVCATARQTAGVGRRGTAWLSGPDCITFSVMSTLSLAPQQIAGLSLVTGLAVAEVLQPLVRETLQLKWPNDLLVGEQKLCGILTELPRLCEDSVTAVTGIGINYCRDPEHEQLLRPYTTLRDLVTTKEFGGGEEASDSLPAREVLIAQISAAVVASHWRFVREGWDGFAEAFKPMDYLAGKAVHIRQGEEIINGIARGVDASGALILEVDGVERSMNAGEVTIGHQGLKEN